MRTSTGFKPVTSRYRCDALTNWAMKPLTLGAGHLWVLMSPWRMDVKWYNETFHISLHSGRTIILFCSIIWKELPFFVEVLQIVAFYFLMEWVRCHSRCDDQWRNVLICFEGRNSKNIRSAAKLRHHRTKGVLPHSQETNNSSRSTACRFRTAQTTRRDVS